VKCNYSHFILNIDAESALVYTTNLGYLYYTLSNANIVCNLSYPFCPFIHNLVYLTL